MLATQQMGVLFVHLGQARRRAGHGLFFLLCLSALIGCNLPSAREKSREDIMRRDVRSFHWALIGQDVPLALRHVPSDERDAWEDAFTCLFKQLRLLDYRVELVKFAEKSNEATVRVRWEGNELDSLVVKKMLWNEQWSFDSDKQRWSLLPGPDALKGLPEDCSPEIPGKEAPDEDESAE
ncbi:MAG: hypothetical protein ACWGSD_08510 [Thermodesulfobacteriota bacterium]